MRYVCICKFEPPKPKGSFVRTESFFTLHTINENRNLAFVKENGNLVYFTSEELATKYAKENNYTLVDAGRFSGLYFTLIREAQEAGFEIVPNESEFLEKMYINRSTPSIFEGKDIVEATDYTDYNHQIGQYIVDRRDVAKYRTFDKNGKIQISKDVIPLISLFLAPHYTSQASLVECGVFSQSTIDEYEKIRKIVNAPEIISPFDPFANNTLNESKQDEEASIILTQRESIQERISKKINDENTESTKETGKDGKMREIRYEDFIKIFTETIDNFDTLIEIAMENGIPSYDELNFTNDNTVRVRYMNNSKIFVLDSENLEKINKMEECKKSNNAEFLKKQVHQLEILLNKAEYFLFTDNVRYKSHYTHYIEELNLFIDRVKNTGEIDVNSFVTARALLEDSDMYDELVYTSSEKEYFSQEDTVLSLIKYNLKNK